MHRTPRSASALAMLLLTAVVTACGGGSDSPSENPPPAATPASAAVFDGDAQSAAAGAAVPTPPAVLVKDEDGDPLANVDVAFSVTSGGGSVTGANARTNGSGIARVASWTLGTTPGGNTLRASVSGLSPVTFTATGTGGGQPAARKWTVMVYLAADNNLAVAGVQDLDEMEAAGSDANVQVVVQAEFSQTHLKQAGCTTPACINRPNWNTFRYAIPQAAGAGATGPNGAATDIGNRDMTSAQELRDFISWAKQSYPADNYAVVLWNHGGGYTGLIEDVTSSGSHLMSLADVKTALAQAGGADLTAFDMCLMAGYETLVTLSGLTEAVVFSEEVVPGAGFPYQQVIQGIRGAATAPARDIAGIIADRFHQSYAGNRASTTISAYDLNGAGLANLKLALGALAGSLRNNMGALRPTIAQASAASQKYELKPLTDLGSLMGALDQSIADATISNQIASVLSLATDPAFRIRNFARNGATNSSPVDRSSGLHILLPTGAADELLPASGPASFASYEALYPNESWTLFLNDFLNGAGGGGTLPQLDQGENRFESYLVWDQGAIAAQADVDFVLLEPNGNVYIPAIGSVTPNGHMTNDSRDDGVSFEGYLTNRYIERGEYVIFALLFEDPQNHQPAYNLAYRFGQTVDFQLLLGTNGSLSKANSALTDPNFSMQKVLQGVYTDFKFVGVYDTEGASGALGSARGLSLSRSGTGGGNRMTSAQMDVVRDSIAARRAAKRAGRDVQGRAKLSAPRLPVIAP